MVYRLYPVMGQDYPILLWFWESLIRREEEERREHCPCRASPPEGNSTNCFKPGHRTAAGS